LVLGAVFAIHLGILSDIHYFNTCCFPSCPQVTEHAGTWANQQEYSKYTNTGGIAYLLPKTDNFEYDFTILELYGGAHLTFSGNGTKVKAIQIVGDDTGHLHIPPNTTLQWTQARFISSCQL
jgi:hypothetical protein